MTLDPIENRRVRGVAARRYPLNETCSHPECAESAIDPHHCFRRTLIGGDSWFVAIHEDEKIPEVPIPHVTGLCRKHHDDVTQHRAWIRLESGVFRWLHRPNGETRVSDEEWDVWVDYGPLDPQPAGRTKSGKPKRKRFKGEERKKRRTISIAVPAEAQEDGGEVWDDLLGDGKDGRPYGRVRERLDLCGVDGNRSPYYVIVDALNDWLNG